jgi:hypothetical protein
MCRRGGHPVAGQGFGDGEDPSTGQIFGEDALHHRCGDRVGLQPAQVLAVGGFRGVGVQAGIYQLIPIRWAASQKAALNLRLGGHGGAHPDPNPVTFSLAHPTEYRHHQVMRLGFRVDGSPDLRNPQRNAVMDKHRKGQPVLVAVKGPLRLTDHHRTKTTFGIFQPIQQRGRLGTSFPGNRPGLPNIEKLGHHVAVALDQRPRSRQLPVTGGLRILLILRGHPPIEGKPHHYAAPLS